VDLLTRPLDRTWNTVINKKGDPTMGKRGRKKRSRKGNAANHGKRPNA
jgi:hypothetical protein